MRTKESLNITAKKWYYANKERALMGRWMRKLLNKNKEREWHNNWKNSEKGKEKVKLYRQKEEVKQRNNVRKKLSQAVKKGQVIRKPCEVCGELKVEGHHTDYSKPLEVRWLCRNHHAQEHARLRNNL